MQRIIQEVNVIAIIIALSHVIGNANGTEKKNVQAIVSKLIKETEQEIRILEQDRLLTMEEVEKQNKFYEELPKLVETLNNSLEAMEREVHATSTNDSTTTNTPLQNQQQDKTNSTASQSTPSTRSSTSSLNPSLAALLKKNSGPIDLSKYKVSTSGSRVVSSTSSPASSTLSSGSSNDMKSKKRVFGKPR
jgi:hypothetical protein